MVAGINAYAPFFLNTNVIIVAHENAENVCPLGKLKLSSKTSCSNVGLFL